jgi:hypothetical protein
MTFSLQVCVTARAVILSVLALKSSHAANHGAPTVVSAFKVSINFTPTQAVVGIYTTVPLKS